MMERSFPSRAERVVRERPELADAVPQIGGAVGAVRVDQLNMESSSM